MTKILILGSRVESYHCFHFLINHFQDIDIVAVAPHVTPVNLRSDQDITTLAKAHNIEIIHRNQICEQKFDLGISLLYDSVLTEQELQIPAKGFINLHLGPLPRYRGSNSVLHAIANARKENCWEFEVTLHYMVEKLDAGPIIDRRSMPIFEDDTAYSLHCRASDKVYELFIDNIGRIIKTDGFVPAQAQTGKAGFYPRDRVNHHIDLSLPEVEIYDKIRSLTFPGKPRPYTLINNKKVYLTLDEK
ncbi:MAG: hypothetical protein CSB48_10295 [Proteobacteria bacterium]|nr:MAG: hypothetical protein CSB48_10295 [Pseudomonadota bacterium]